MSSIRIWSTTLSNLKKISIETHSFVVSPGLLFHKYKALLEIQWSNDLTRISSLSVRMSRQSMGSVQQLLSRTSQSLALTVDSWSGWKDIIK